MLAFSISTTKSTKTNAIINNEMRKKDFSYSVICESVISYTEFSRKNVVFSFSFEHDMSDISNSRILIYVSKS